MSEEVQATKKGSEDNDVSHQEAETSFVLLPGSEESGYWHIDERYMLVWY